jgi:S-DNA-T family DNA segregation ATPase FtsK/SpoIIIE
MSYGTVTEIAPDEGRLRVVVLRQTLRIAGLAAMLLAAALAASLVTWNVDDPSFSYAAESPVHNLLGRPGAIFADLAMQFLGLAVVGLLCPFAVFGWSLFRLRLPRWPLRQLIAWLGGAVLLSAALACFPTSAKWPLPTGFGGAAGDLVLALPEWFGGGALSGGAYAALCVILGGLSLGLLWGACISRPATFATAGRTPARRSRNEEMEAEDEEEEESRSVGTMRIAAGVLAHWALTARAMIRRKLAGRPAHTAHAPRVVHRAIAGPRREPMFDGGEAGEDEDDPEFDMAFAEAIEAHAAPAASPAKRPRDLVQPTAPRPKPSVRIGKDGQPALLAGAKFALPALNLLAEPKHRRRDTAVDTAALEQNARLLEGVLEDFGVRGEIINVRPGPVVTLYELEPAPGIKSSRVISLADDIARSMSAIAARVAVIPGRNVIGIELPNAGRETVYLRELLASADFDSSKAKLALSLGKTIGGEPVIADLAKMPHLLVAGTTGSGKSVAINTMILALVYRLTPDQCRLIMIDPKMLELSVYDGIPHLLTPVVTDPKKAIVALKWTVREMEDRYKKMSKLGVRNIDGFNQRIALAAKKGEMMTRTVQTGFDQETGEPVFETEELELEPMPYIVVIIDEMADLMMVAGKDIEGAVQRLAQMARAAGIHVIMATQRPSVDVITGTIKANFPTRISFQVTSKIDSRTILGEQGAEQLLGQGDMLYMAGGGRIQRVHGPFVSDQEVEAIVAHLKTQGAPDYLDSITDDEAEEGGNIEAFAGDMENSADLYDQAVAVVLRDRKVSTSYIQRRLSIGYNRAASIIEKMEKEGVVGPANHAGKREILVGENAA